jgi:hypothetical protein
MNGLPGPFHGSIRISGINGVVGRKCRRVVTGEDPK